MIGVHLYVGWTLSLWIVRCPYFLFLDEWFVALLSKGRGIYRFDWCLEECQRQGPYKPLLTFLKCSLQWKNIYLYYNHRDGGGGAEDKTEERFWIGEFRVVCIRQRSFTMQRIGRETFFLVPFAASPSLTVLPGPLHAF